MKKVKLVLLILLLCSCLVGFSRSKPPKLSEGTYDVQRRILARFDLASGEMNDIKSNVAEMFDSFPENINLSFETNDMKESFYGRVLLGNTGQETWFFLGQRGEELVVYVDMDGDGEIGKKEQVKSFTSGVIEKKEITNFQFFTAIPIGIDVNFRNEEKTIKHKLFFFISLSLVVKDDLQEVYVSFIDASFFDGKMPIVRRGKTFSVKFRIVDGDSNGCFNDYGRDILYVDVNGDGYYVNKECWPLSEYFFNNDNKQIRFVVTPQPKKLLITQPEATVNRSELEDLGTK